MKFQPMQIRYGAASRWPIMAELASLINAMHSFSLSNFAGVSMNF